MKRDLTRLSRKEYVTVCCMRQVKLRNLMSGNSRAAGLLAVYRFSATIVGRSGGRSATAAAACFGGLAAGIAGGLKLRHDYDSQFVADDYQRELAFLGIESSPAFVRDPRATGCVERFIRTLKENLLWLSRFDTIEELRLALHAFKDSYNRTWIVERHGYQTPAAIRAAQLAPLPAAA
jgi:putative transposase